MHKRRFLQSLAAGAATLAVTARAADPGGSEPVAPGLAGLPDLAAAARPIDPAEHRDRVAKAQRLLRDAGLGALLLEAGSALVYFTGVQWGRSERFTGAVIPAEGDIAYVTPAFEEPSLREVLRPGDDVRTWQEHENPFTRVRGILADRGMRRGRLAVEETVRFFVVDGVRRAASAFELVPGTAITRGCRMYKSAAEIALMQTANDITLAAYHYVYPRVDTGMRPAQIAALMDSATRALGGEPEFALVLLNEASAYPHGTAQPQAVTAGGIVLMDCGCSVHGYESDISRTWVHGEATAQQRRVWNTVRRGQELALATATPGTPAGRVDDVVRSYYERSGFEPGYRTPGLSHRLGHGIGLDGHESVNFVHGEQTPLAPGMCLSNEPGIYLPGAFGVRLEDCLYITDAGPVLFSALSPTLDAPFARQPGAARA